MPLSTNYSADPAFKFVGQKLNTQEGYNFYKEQYLLSAHNATTNGYTSNFLTHKHFGDDIFSINTTTKNVSSFTTTIAFYDTFYLTLCASNNGNSTPAVLDYTFTTIDNVVIDNNDRYFEIELLSPLSARIAHQRENNRYYLTYDNGFSFESNGNVHESTFLYVYDQNANALTLFKQLSVTYAINYNNNRLTLVPVTSGLFSLFSDNNYCTVYNNSNTIPTKLNTSWVAYNTFDKNALSGNPDTSFDTLQNNYFVHSCYSNITGDSIDANFVTLKNQHSNKHYSYNGNLITGINNDLRNYTNVFTGNNQELSEDITFAYEFYNADYIFKADKLSVFYTPNSLYPFEKLNINDSNWSQIGSIGGDTPYLADKIYWKKVSGNTDTSGQYLCTWLSAGNTAQAGIWVDRYYYPERTTYLDALKSTPNAFSYTDPIECLINQNAGLSNHLDNNAYFDKLSDLTLLPNCEYIYERVGNNYVKQVLKALNDHLIQNGLQALTTKDVEISYSGDVDDIEYTFNNNCYSLITNYENINSTSQFTLAFWLGANDWQANFGHQIVGNLNHTGFGVVNDQKITPIIALQHDNIVYCYNSDFVEIDQITLDKNDFYTIKDVVQNNRTTVTTITSTFIKDLYRTDHLAPAAAIVGKFIDVEYNTVYPQSPFCGLILTDVLPLPEESFQFLSTEELWGLIIEPCPYETLVPSLCP